MMHRILKIWSLIDFVYIIISATCTDIPYLNLNKLVHFFKLPVVENLSHSQIAKS